jgi:hypothetical protein
MVNSFDDARRLATRTHPRPIHPAHYRSRESADLTAAIFGIF